MKQVKCNYFMDGCDQTQMVYTLYFADLKAYGLKWELDNFTRRILLCVYSSCWFKQVTAFVYHETFMYQKKYLRIRFAT